MIGRDFRKALDQAYREGQKFEADILASVSDINQQEETDMGTGVQGAPPVTAAEVMRREARHMRLSAESQQKVASEHRGAVTEATDKAKQWLAEAEKLERAAELLEPGRLDVVGASIDPGDAYDQIYGKAEAHPDQDDARNHIGATVERMVPRYKPKSIPGPLHRIRITAVDAGGYVRTEGYVTQHEIEDNLAVETAGAIVQDMLRDHR